MLNGYSMGGPLILSGIRPYIDGRGDMYGDELVLSYARIIHGDAAAFARRCSDGIFAGRSFPTEPRLIALLDRSSGWRRIASDEAGVIYVDRRLALEEAFELLSKLADRHPVPMCAPTWRRVLEIGRGSHARPATCGRDSCELRMSNGL